MSKSLTYMYVYLLKIIITHRSKLLFDYTFIILSEKLISYNFTLEKSFHSETSIKSKMTKLLILFAFMLISASSGSIIREIRIKTSNCADCGMTFLGELSVKVST